MTFKSGFGSNAKQVIYRLAPDEGEAQLYSLTPRQVKALLANTDYLSWLNRHQTLPADIPDKDTLEAWVSNLNLSLMTPMTPPDIDCDFILDCIMSSLDNPESPLYDKIKEKVTEDPEFLNDIKQALLPFPEEELGGSEELSELWAQCVQVVEFTHVRILNMFADLEVQFNNFELASFIEAVPFIGTLVDEAQIDVAFDIVNYAQDSWKEQYEANYTEDPPPDLGTKYILACALFCDCKDDKEITLERVVSAFQSCILSGGINMDSIGEILQSILGINDNNPNIVYLTFTVVWGIARIASYLGSKRVTHAILAAILELAKNDANDDYETYCEDCPPEHALCLNFLENDQGVLPISFGSAEWIEGKGWGNNSSAGVGIRFQETNIPDQIWKIKFRYWRKWNGATSNPYYDRSSGTVQSATGTAGTMYWGQGADPPRENQEETLTAPEGTHWNKADLFAFTWASSYTWPGIADNDADEQYLMELCFNEDA